MKPCILPLLVLSLGSAQGATNATAPAVAAQLAPVVPHPRLLWPAGGEETVRRRIAADPLWADTYQAIQLSADRMLAQPTVEYHKEGRRLLAQSRRALGLVVHLAFLHRMTGDPRYRDRAVRELRAAAAFPDWNQSHFLDTAEMTLAFAIGYDWLHGALTADERALIRTAIEQKGLAPYLGAPNRPGWERGGNNWNQVCHAGMVGGALALLEADPDRAGEVVSRALAGLPAAMRVYDPDGTYPEGPGYWTYGTTFNVALIAMLESALSTDFDLARAPGFLRSGDFMLHTSGPTGRYFNFSDCGELTGANPALWWFARRAQRPDWLWFDVPRLRAEVGDAIARPGRSGPDRFFPFILIWAPDQPARAEPATRAWLGDGPNPIATFRTAWTSDAAAFLAVKAGSPGASHGHMDIGSFIYEANGVRWSEDLGMQGYHAMESRGLNIWNSAPGSDRWRIFRYHNRAHSTLLVDDREQVVRGRSVITGFTNTPSHMGCAMDLGPVYAGQLAAARRTFSLLADGRAVIEDHVTGGTNAAVVRWAMVTPGRVEADARGAWLTHNGKRLRLDVTASQAVRVETYQADPPPNDFDAPNPGLRLVGFTVSVAAGQSATWRVTLTP